MNPGNYGPSPRARGSHAQDTSETVNRLNNAPVVLIDDGHTIVTVDYKAVKAERGWAPTA